MQRAFFCICVCVRAFQCCLPVICIDDTFLTGRYKCQIHTAIRVDCNNQIVPLAFAFVENENLDSWYWFLERVKVHIVAARPDVCLISDRHAGLLQSILKLQRGTATTPPLWPDVQNRWCIVARVRLQRLGIQLRSHFHTGFEVHLRRNGHSFMIPTEYGMVFR